MSSPDEMDQLFKALADPSRRQILDLLKARPGQNVSDLTEQFPFSRFAVMKHLRILEEANLVTSRREGRSRQLFLNAVPIQTLADRWMSSFSALWASSLTSMKYQLENGEEPMSTPDQVYVVYIRTTPEKLWQCLTEPEMTRHYFHGTDFQSELTMGASIEYKLTEGDSTRVAVSGEIFEIEPPRRLGYTFRFMSNDDPHTRVRYAIDPVGDMVKLTVTHEGFDGETETYKDTQQGWPPILSGLKTLLETGEPLQFPEE